MKLAVPQITLLLVFAFGYMPVSAQGPDSRDQRQIERQRQENLSRHVERERRLRSPDRGSIGTTGRELWDTVFEYWNTPEGRSRYEQLQLARFNENFIKLTQLGNQDWANAIHPDRSRELEGWTDELEDVTDNMLKFLEWRYQVELLEPTASEESIQDRLGRLTPMVEQILKTSSTLSVGTIDIQGFAMMHQNLVDLRQLSRDLKRHSLIFNYHR